MIRISSPAGFGPASNVLVQNIGFGSLDNLRDRTESESQGQDARYRRLKHGPYYYDVNCTGIGMEVSKN